ncbi:hypothetical protein G9A89_004359 [Geosiphon pyriformis]|nr:hypothetical protein G9A89_004359 [Geosiphon pyriformis]
MDATQYQALVRNDWLTKANAILDWTTQELLINYNGHQAKIPATCDHFQKLSANQRPIFEFEENPALPAIKTYQLSWADDQRTGLPVVPTWTSKERSEWNQTKTQETPPTTIVTVVTKKNTVTQKDTENGTRNRASLVKNCYQEGATEMTYQTKKERVTQLANTRSSSVTGLQHYPHDENELYNTAQAKVKGRTTEEIRRWKESAEVADKVANYNMFDPVDKFQDYYQQLCPTRQEQEQYFAQINTYLCENCLIPC